MPATKHNGHSVTKSTIARDHLPVSQRRFISERVLRLELDNGATIYGCADEGCERVFEPESDAEEAHFHAIAQVRAHLGMHTKRRGGYTRNVQTERPTFKVPGGPGVSLDIDALLEAFTQLADGQAIVKKLQHELANADEEIGEWKQRTLFLERTMRKVYKTIGDALGE